MKFDSHNKHPKPFAAACLELVEADVDVDVGEGVDVEEVPCVVTPWPSCYLREVPQLQEVYLQHRWAPGAGKKANEAY